MKSLLVSALAVGVAVGIDSAYYIGNYTANGQVNLVPYPLGVCTPTGALTGFTYSIFNCVNGTKIEQKKYAMSDSTCSGSYTSVTFPQKDVPGLGGYAHCDGPSSYMLIGQYISSCNNWKLGKAGSASTIVATDACTYAGVSGGVSLYSRSTCDAEGQVMKVYAGDSTCTNNLVQTIPSVSECHFYGTQSGINVYSATLKCVVDSEIQRCESPLANYEALVTLFDVKGTPSYREVYQKVFEYSTVAVSVLNDTVEYALLDLNLSFCNQYEDAKYATSVKNLGKTTSDTFNVTDVCWTCIGFTCTNSTLCGTDNYCTMSEQCTATSTTTTEEVSSTSTSTTTTETGTTDDTASPANAIYVSFTLIMGLLLSLALF